MNPILVCPGRTLFVVCVSDFGLFVSLLTNQPLGGRGTTGVRYASEKKGMRRTTVSFLAISLGYV